MIFHLPFFCWTLRFCVPIWPQSATECEIRRWCSCIRSSTWISAIQHATDSSKPDLQLKLSNVLLLVLCFSSTFRCFMIKLSSWAYVFRKTEYVNGSWNLWRKGLLWNSRNCITRPVTHGSSKQMMSDIMKWQVGERRAIIWNVTRLNPVIRWGRGVKRRLNSEGCNVVRWRHLVLRILVGIFWLAITFSK